MIDGGWVFDMIGGENRLGLMGRWGEESSRGFKDMKLEEDYMLDVINVTRDKQKLE